MADVRYALRRLSQAPGFAVVALLTLALGIGANSAIFSVVYGVLFRPLGFRASDELVRLYSDMRGERFSAVSGPLFLDVRDRARTLGEVGRQPLDIVGAAPRVDDARRAGFQCQH